MQFTCNINKSVAYNFLIKNVLLLLALLKVSSHFYFRQSDIRYRRKFILEFSRPRYFLLVRVLWFMSNVQDLQRRKRVWKGYSYDNDSRATALMLGMGIIHVPKLQPGAVSPPRPGLLLSEDYQHQVQS